MEILGDIGLPLPSAYGTYNTAGLGFEFQVLKTFQGVPFSLRSGFITWQQRASGVSGDIGNEDGPGDPGRSTMRMSGELELITWEQRAWRRRGSWWKTRATSHPGQAPRSQTSPRCRSRCSFHSVARSSSRNFLMFGGCGSRVGSRVQGWGLGCQ